MKQKERENPEDGTTRQKRENEEGEAKETRKAGKKREP